MTDANKQTNNSKNQDKKPRMSIRGQYIKDLSFESPQSPQNLLPQKQQPKIAVNVDINARKLNENMYETALKITVKAEVEDKPFFLVELDYGGIFAIENIREDQMEPMLFIECPFILFPFARRVIADITRDGGFPPLMLDPIDFHYLYARRKQSQAENSSDKQQTPAAAE